MLEEDRAALAASLIRLTARLRASLTLGLVT